MDKHFLDSKAMGLRIRTIRDGFGLSRDSFAKEIGSFSVSSVRKWESGSSVSSLGAVVAISNRFNASVDELVLGFTCDLSVLRESSLGDVEIGL